MFKKLCCFSTWAVVLLLGSFSLADDVAEKPDPDDASEESAAESDEVQASLKTVQNLFETRREKLEELNKAKSGQTPVEQDIKEKAVIEVVNELQGEIDSIDEQISGLAAGVAESEFDLSSSQAIDLQTEIEQLVQPFIIMLRSATEEARQIENLRRSLSIVTSQRDIAARAVARIGPLIEQNDDAELAKELERLHEKWDDRLAEAEDLIAATDSQLALRLARRDSADSSAGRFADAFFRGFAWHLVQGLAVFVLVLLILRFLGKLVGQGLAGRGVRRSTSIRAGKLVFGLTSLLAAWIAMMVTFNALNDWLLLGIGIIFFTAIVWVTIKMLPNLLEQVGLYLNLGAVQEGERLMFSGVPWLVQHLDFYTDLTNPVLQGGKFTVPIRELTGLHSRPLAKDEVWFPTEKGDWVRLEQGVGQVIMQTPGLVQIEMLGGAILTHSATDFFENAPVNLSHGSRAEIEFGLSYKHQDIATSEIPEKLTTFVRGGLLEILSPGQLLGVDVEVLQAGASSIDYEVEADISGDAAMHYETVERALASLCIEACNKYGWEIPFPQMVMHRM